MELKYIIIIIVAFALLITIGLAIVNFSYAELLNKFNSISSLPAGTTPYDFAKHINEIFFNNSIHIKFSDKLFSDCYNTIGTLTLCKQYANDNNLAGLAICAHELGHAVQFKNDRSKIFKFAKKKKLSEFLSKIITPIFIGAIACLIFNQLIISICLFATSFVLFMIALSSKMSTIKIEKEASQNAIALLKDYAYLDDQQLYSAKKLLNSAKLTYVADMLRSMLKWTRLTKK